MEQILNELNKYNLTTEKYEKILKAIADKKDGISDMDWSDICDIYGIELNTHSLRKMNDGIFGGYFIKKYMENKYENSSIDDNEVIKKIEEKKRELEKLKVQYQDQRREYIKYIRQDARFEHLQNEIIKAVKDVNFDYPLVSKVTTPKGKSEAVLILSDWHIGIEIDNYWNKFCKEIALERISKLSAAVIDKCKKDNVSVLHIELLGDMVNGAIHISTRIENEEDVISQVMTCSEMLAQMIHRLSQEIPQIKVYSSTGNHGRVNANIKESIEPENFERLITWYLKPRLKECKNVSFIDNHIDRNIIVYKFLNETIFAVHGHLDKPSKVINDLTQMLKVFPTQVHMGHYHHGMTDESNDIDIIVNGTLSGTDEFSKRIRKTNKPSQTLITYNENGQDGYYKIKL